MRFNASLPYIIRNYSPLNSLSRDRFQDWPKATLAKNRLAFAIENVIAGFGQRENTTKQIRLGLSAIVPERPRPERNKKTKKSNKRGRCGTLQNLAAAKLAGRQSARKSEQRPAVKDERQREQRRIIPRGEEVHKSRE